MQSFLQFLEQIRKSQKSQYSMCNKPQMKSVLNLFSSKLEKHLYSALNAYSVLDEILNFWHFMI